MIYNTIRKFIINIKINKMMVPNQKPEFKLNILNLWPKMSAIKMGKRINPNRGLLQAMPVIKTIMKTANRQKPNTFMYI